MKKQQKQVFLILLLTLTLPLCTACQSKEETSVREAVVRELDGLKNTDAETIAAYAKEEGLLPPSAAKDSQDFDFPASSSSLKLAKLYRLFFENFSYQIKEVSIKSSKDPEAGKESGESMTADVKIEVTTLDMEQAAKDFISESLKKRITLDATPSSVEFSLKDSYLLLTKLLETRDYDTKTRSAVIQLEKDSKEGTWHLVPDSELDQLFTGNFLQYMTDSNLLSPSEIVDIHFGTIQGFDSEQLRIYLSLDNLLDTDSNYNQEISHAISDQISALFDYEILKEDLLSEDEATVQVSIVSVNFQNILHTYTANLSAWLETSESLAVGAEGRREKERALLLSAIQENEDSTSRKISVHLQNDGVNWKIQMDSEIAQAVFGDIQTAMDSISNDVE